MKKTESSEQYIGMLDSQNPNETRQVNNTTTEGSHDRGTNANLEIQKFEELKFLLNEKDEKIQQMALECRHLSEDSKKVTEAYAFQKTQNENMQKDENHEQESLRGIVLKLKDQKKNQEEEIVKVRNVKVILENEFENYNENEEYQKLKLRFQKLEKEYNRLKAFIDKSGLMDLTKLDEIEGVMPVEDHRQKISDLENKNQNISRNLEQIMKELENNVWMNQNLKIDFRNLEIQYQQDTTDENQHNNCIIGRNQDRDAYNKSMKELEIELQKCNQKLQDNFGCIQNQTRDKLHTEKKLEEFYLKFDSVEKLLAGKDSQIEILRKDREDNEVMLRKKLSNSRKDNKTLKTEYENQLVYKDKLVSRYKRLKEKYQKIENDYKDYKKAYPSTIIEQKIEEDYDGVRGHSFGHKNSENDQLLANQQISQQNKDLENQKISKDAELLEQKRHYEMILDKERQKICLELELQSYKAGHNLEQHTDQLVGDLESLRKRLDYERKKVKKLGNDKQQFLMKKNVDEKSIKKPVVVNSTKLDKVVENVGIANPVISEKDYWERQSTAKDKQIEDLQIQFFLVAAENDRLRNKDQLVRNIDTLKNSPLAEKIVDHYKGDNTSCYNDQYQQSLQQRIEKNEILSIKNSWRDEISLGKISEKMESQDEKLDNSCSNAQKNTRVSSKGNSGVVDQENIPESKSIKSIGSNEIPSHRDLNIIIDKKSADNTRERSVTPKRYRPVEKDPVSPLPHVDNFRKIDEKHWTTPLTQNSTKQVPFSLTATGQTTDIDRRNHVSGEMGLSNHLSHKEDSKTDQQSEGNNNNDKIVEKISMFSSNGVAGSTNPNINNDVYYCKNMSKSEYIQEVNNNNKQPNKEVGFSYENDFNIEELVILEKIKNGVCGSISFGNYTETSTNNYTERIDSLLQRSKVVCDWAEVENSLQKQIKQNEMATSSFEIETHPNKNPDQNYFQNEQEQQSKLEEDNIQSSAMTFNRNANNYNQKSIKEVNESDRSIQIDIKQQAHNLNKSLQLQDQNPPEKSPEEGISFYEWDLDYVKNNPMVISDIQKDENFYKNNLMSGTMNRMTGEFKNEQGIYKKQDKADLRSHLQLVQTQSSEIRIDDTVTYPVGLGHQILTDKNNVSIIKKPIKKIGKLVVSINSAELLHNEQDLTRIDPYCKILLGDRIHRTKVHKNGSKHPKWNESFIFPIDLRRQPELQDSKIRLEICYLDPILEEFSSSVEIGLAYIQSHNSMMSDWFEQIDSNLNKDGKIHIEFNFIENIISHSQELRIFLENSNIVNTPKNQPNKDSIENSLDDSQDKILSIDREYTGDSRFDIIGDDPNKHKYFDNQGCPSRVSFGQRRMSKSQTNTIGWANESKYSEVECNLTAHDDPDNSLHRKNNFISFKKNLVSANQDFFDEGNGDKERYDCHSEDKVFGDGD